VEEYNTLIDEQRFAEAEVIAKKAAQSGRRSTRSLGVDPGCEPWLFLPPRYRFFAVPLGNH